MWIKRLDTRTSSSKLGYHPITVHKLINQETMRTTHYTIQSSALTYVTDFDIARHYGMTPDAWYILSTTEKNKLLKEYASETAVLMHKTPSHNPL